MTELVTLARPYAKAAFAHASESSALATWSDALIKASQVSLDSEFKNYLARPNLSAEQKASTLLSILETSDAGFNNFIKLLGQNDRLALLPDISSEFELLKAAGLNELEVTVETAYALTPEQVATLTEKLSQRFNAKVTITTQINPELIGGVVIHAGDQVIDDSVRTKLEKLRTSLN